MLIRDILLNASNHTHTYSGICTDIGQNIILINERHILFKLCKKNNKMTKENKFSKINSLFKQLKD